MSAWKDILSRETIFYIEEAQNNQYSSISEGFTARSYLTSYDTEPVTGAVRALLPLRITIANKKGLQNTFTMLVNPENINHGRTHAIYANYTRKGYVTQMWGPNQDLLTGTGKTAAFMSKPEGLTRNSKVSFAFHNFMALLASYRNNGYIFYDPSEMQEPLTRIINTINGVELEYDNQIFMGHFNNFTIDESSEQPFSLNYSFEFVTSTLSRNYDQVRGHFVPITREDITSTVLVNQVE